MAESPSDQQPQPLAAFPAAAAAGLRGVLLDIDDTLTSEGRLTAQAYGALERLQAAGLLVLPITGRPAGWCDLIARFWPVDGVVGENGAFYFRYDHGARRMTRCYHQEPDLRAANRARLMALGQEILAAVPGAALASDQAYRESDLAIDFREDVAPLGPEAVARIVALFQAAGARAKVSSIHVNGWFGDYDKLTMTRRLLDEVFALGPDALRQSLVFVGDSPNDGPLFQAFSHGVGVANVMDFAGQMAAMPRYVTKARAGAGFAELAGFLLAARKREGRKRC